jgi:hypothetical protein
MWDAIVQFEGQANIAISPAASPEFPQVIQAAFVGGFDRALKIRRTMSTMNLKHFSLHEDRWLCENMLSKPPPPSGMRCKTF